MMAGTTEIIKVPKELEKEFFQLANILGVKVRVIRESYEYGKSLEKD